MQSTMNLFILPILAQQNTRDTDVCTTVSNKMSSTPNYL